jgi:hypothetical protein
MAQPPLKSPFSSVSALGNHNQQQPDDPGAAPNSGAVTCAENTQGVALFTCGPPTAVRLIHSIE